MSRYNQLDREIIAHLNRDARKSSAQIARELGVSERTVHNRIRRLIDQGVIHAVAVVNRASFGYTLAIDIFCELEVGHQIQAIEAIARMPEVSYIAISTGDQDISLQAVFKTGEEMEAFLTDKLHQVPGMRRTRTVLIPRIIKDSFQWLPPEELFDHNNVEN